jgi:hypothetical protein
MTHSTNVDPTTDCGRATRVSVKRREQRGTQRALIEAAHIEPAPASASRQRALELAQGGAPSAAARGGGAMWAPAA